MPESLDKRTSTQIIQDWLSTCTHQHDCFSNQLPRLPARVLDLAPLSAGEHIVLVETGAENGRYMTLSHCWGNSKTIETRKETLPMMKLGIPWSTLPRTFQDAVSIAQELSIRYLWIDSLCIIQDDIADWERESSKMATIYANTYLNIAATCSRNSHDGFFKPRWMEAMSLSEIWSCPTKDVKIEGIHEGQPCEIFARFEQWRAHQDFLASDNASDIHIRSPLLARAWVFQELYLSPRTIHFHSSELVWECKDCVRCECTELEREINERNALSRHRQLGVSSLDPNQRLYFWLSIVNDYCKLNLTHESDRLPALAGLASRFAHQTTGKYFAGLWQKDLVRMLLWSLKHSWATCTRSRPSTAPSWSWASIAAYLEPSERGDNSPNYILVQDSHTSFRQDTNAHVLKVECSAPGINPFGEVPIGTILIHSTVLHSTLVRRRRLTHIGQNLVRTGLNLNHDNTIDMDSHVISYSAEEVHHNPEICIGADLIFAQEEDDLIIVTRHSFIPDIWLGEEEEILDGDKVLCLLLGTSEIRWRLSARATVALCLVLRYSTNREGAFERIGVMFCDTDSRIFRPRENCVVELV